MTSLELADLDRPAIRRMSEIEKISSTPREETTEFDSATSTLYDGEVDGTLLADPEQKKSEVLAVDPPATNSRFKLTMWMTVNTLATIGIVFANKAIFSDSSFKSCQVSFASFHFFVTATTLYILSRPVFPLFKAKHVNLQAMLPLAIAMCLNVILMNLSLTYSSITFYQIARILLTPAVAAINFLFYRKTIPRMALVTLIPMCLGVGMISYYEPKPAASGKDGPSLDFLGVFLALSGVLVSAVYMVWVSAYQRRFEMNSFQLLFNQAPLGGALLIVFIPFLDKLPSKNKAYADKSTLILLSTICAVLINVSQVFIIAGAGPVSSTVAGHVKTCAIVMLGWITSGRGVSDKSVLGVLLAVGSIVFYTMVVLRTNKS